MTLLQQRKEPYAVYADAEVSVEGFVPFKTEVTVLVARKIKRNLTSKLLHAVFRGQLHL